MLVCSWMCIYECLHVFTYLRIYVLCMYVSGFMYVCLFAYLSACACMYEFMHVCMLPCIYASAHMYMYVGLLVGTFGTSRNDGYSLRSFNNWREKLIKSQLLIVVCVTFMKFIASRDLDRLHVLRLSSFVQNLINIEIHYQLVVLLLSADSIHILRSLQQKDSWLQQDHSREDPFLVRPLLFFIQSHRLVSFLCCKWSREEHLIKLPTQKQSFVLYVGIWGWVFAAQSLTIWSSKSETAFCHVRGSWASDLWSYRRMV